MSGGVVLVLLVIFNIHQLEFIAQLLTLIICILIIVVPIIIIGILIYKLFKYLDAKTKYYNKLNKDSFSDRQD